MMKKIMAVFAVVLLLFQCPGGTAEPLAQAAAEANILIRFEETFMQAFALGDTAAYVLDHQGMLWTWHYNEDEPQAICQLAPYPETVFSSGKPYKEMDGADQAVAADTVQVLAEARGALYGVNQLAGRIGTVDGEGIHWQREFDAALLLTSQGEARYIMGQAVVGETLYLLEADWEKGENAAQLASLDLQTGETRLMDAPEGAASLCAYGEELLLLGGDGNRGWLMAMNPAAGESRELPHELPGGEAGGLAYRMDNDTLCVVTERGVLTAQGTGEFTLASNNPATYVSSFMRARFLPDGRYVLAGDGIRALPLGNGARNQALLTLRLDSAMGAELIQAFQADYPQVLMDIQTQEMLTAAEVAEAIRSGDQGTDIFCVRVDRGFGQLVDKGYAAPLDASPAITASAAAMYPAIRAVVTNRQGQTVAYPIALSLNLWSMNQALWEGYFPGESRPTTWQGLFRTMLRFEEENNDDENLFLTEWDYEPMVKAVLRAFIQQREARGLGVDFNEASLRETLTLLSRVNGLMLEKGIDYLFDGDVHPESEVLGEYAIFSQGGSGYSTYKATLDGYGGLMPFTFGEGETPFVPGYMLVLLVNPLSKQLDLALDFVAQAAKPESGMMRYYMLHESATEPVENPDWKERMAKARQEREALEARLSDCDPADRRRLEDDIAAAHAEEAWQEGRQWKISVQGIAGWQAVAPNLRFFENASLLSEEMEAQMDVLVARYGAGQLELDGLLRQLDQVARQIYLEQAQ